MSGEQAKELEYRRHAMVNERRGRQSARDNAVSLRVLIADDQPRARDGLKALLTALRWGVPDPTEPPTRAGYLHVDVVGEAEDGLQAVEQVSALHPDVAVMDLHAHLAPALDPALDGVATIQTIKREWPAVRIVVLTMYATDRAAFLAAGADAFVLKGCPTSELLDAVMPGRPMSVA
jgi:DNA-binding NarL/FixJ family response regulator